MWNKVHAALRNVLSGGVSVFKRNQSEGLPVWLIVGLGNPDREHAGNRHNIGFMALDRVVHDLNLPEWRKRFQGFTTEGQFNGIRAVLLKPQTYMNVSGRSVREAANFYKIPPEKIIVLHDELDLPLGKVKVKTGGGAAGHNGLKSIDADTGTQNYIRVRMGIGHPGDRARVSGYVLSDFTPDERHVVDILCAGVSRHMALLLSAREADFMTKIAEETKEH